MDKKIVKRIEGEIEDKTDNSILINKLWIKFFDSEKLKDIYEDDYVKVVYTDNTKDGKTYHNGQEIILTPRTQQLNQKVNISDTTINTLIMTIKEIYISDNELTYDAVTEMVLESYKKIKALI